MIICIEYACQRELELLEAFLPIFLYGYTFFYDHLNQSSAIQNQDTIPPHNMLKQSGFLDIDKHNDR